MTSTGSTRPAGLRRALLGLCVTETTSWGLLYYAFAVLLGPISADTGWSQSALSGAFTCGLVVSALAGIPMGRLMDGHGPRPVMTAGSVLASASLVVIAVVPSLPLFYLGWMLAGVAMSAVLYQAAFAAITGWFQKGRVRALTTVTLVAGLASTIYAPVTDVLSRHLPWRDVYLVLALVLAVVTVPIHLVVLTPAWRTRPAGHPSPAAVPGAWRLVRGRRFIAVAGALTVGTLGAYGPTLIVIPLLLARGMDMSLAVLTFGLLGAGQLLGRIGFAPLSARVSPGVKMAVILCALGLFLALLAMVPGPIWLLILLAILTGAARGAMTLLQATIVADYWGTSRYATIAGLVGMPVTLAVAIAPWVGTAVADGVGGYPAAFGIFAAVAGAVGIASVGARRYERPSPVAGGGSLAPQ